MSLNWTVHFVAERGVIGRDLALSLESFSVPHEEYILEDPKKIALVVSDWDEDVVRLWPPAPPGVPDWMQLAWEY